LASTKVENFHLFCPFFFPLFVHAMELWIVETCFPSFILHVLLSIICPCHGAVDSGAMFSQDIHLKVSSIKGFFSLLSLLILLINFLQCPGFALIVNGQ